MTEARAEEPGRSLAETVALPSGLSAGYRSALLAALSAHLDDAQGESSPGAADTAASQARRSVFEALHTLERLDEKALGPDAAGAGANGSHRTLEAAERKAEQAERDLAEKRVPYEADPLFMYLWNRGFGTGAYRASNLVRYFDRKVARLVGYQDARVNYAMLLELPVRIREHAERLKAALAERGPGGHDTGERLPSADLAADYERAIEAADRAYATARVSAPSAAATANGSLVAAERKLGEARTALLAKLCR